MSDVAAQISELSPNDLGFKSVFDAYVCFKSLPHWLRYPLKDRKSGYRPTPRQCAESFGFDDDGVLALIELQTQKNFAARFGVTEQTLGRWSKIIEKQDLLKEAVYTWAQRLSANVLFGHYMQMINGDASPQHYRLWYQMVMGWSEKKLPELNRRTIKTVRVEIVDPFQGKVASEMVA